MENYIVSARKYRPSTFESVVGQRALTTTLKNAIATGKLAHAYLFCGPRGVGKTTCARIFAKTINCMSPTAEGEACNQCESCTAFNEQRSYNIHELDAASNNSVDDIRQLVEQVRIPPQIGKYKVYIIDEVHMLSASAFNAFLKTLEEPPRHAIFILATTEKHKILPTILSRCQIYDFNRISVEDTVAHLAYVASKEGITAEPEALNVIALKADGGMLSTFLAQHGMNISFYSDPGPWRLILVIMRIWQGAGYGAIVYIATITGMDPGIYEAAEIDGASRWQQIIHLTLPMLKPTIVLMTLFSVGRIFYGDFGMIYGLVQDNSMLFSTTDVIDTYVYRMLRQLNNYGMSTAVGLIQSVLGFVFVYFANNLARRFEPDSAIF